MLTLKIDSFNSVLLTRGLGQEKRTLLHQAAYHGKMNVMKVILEQRPEFLDLTDQVHSRAALSGSVIIYI
jgi:hypothetical protein